MARPVGPRHDRDPLTQVFNGTVRMARWDSASGMFVPAEGIEPINGLDVLAKILGG